MMLMLMQLESAVGHALATWPDPCGSTTGGDGSGGMSPALISLGSAQAVLVCMAVWLH